MNYNRKNRIRKYARPSGDFVSKAEFDCLKRVLEGIRRDFCDYVMEQPNKEAIKQFARLDQLQLPILGELMTEVRLEPYGVENTSCQIMRINHDEARTILRCLKMIRAFAGNYRWPSRFEE